MSPACRSACRRAEASAVLAGVVGPGMVNASVFHPPTRRIRRCCDPMAPSGRCRAVRAPPVRHGLLPCRPGDAGHLSLDLGMITEPSAMAIGPSGFPKPSATQLADPSLRPLPSRAFFEDHSAGSAASSTRMVRVFVRRPEVSWRRRHLGPLVSSMGASMVSPDLGVDVG